MSIKVKFFGSVRETLGQSNTTVEADGITTVLDVWQHVTDNAPVDGSVFCSVNLEHRDMNYAANDGDEVAFFPPITGG